ncbi:uncharacterized protein LOC143286474 isoform X2 [Babylonia areolata]|uniref:uncharacterized protein LOC143286474 isoform X2 n=1 Tax=Babylonia areolata TaxID=304850 RepID=UPI003FD1AC30
MDGSEKLPLMTIGKFMKPRCFRRVKVPVAYKANPKAWMTSEIFIPWLVSFDREMEQQKRKVLVVLDNCSSHKIPDLKATKVLFLPANATSKLQPLDVGIIRNMKIHYRAAMVSKLLAHIDAGGTAEDFQFSLLGAVSLLKQSWNKVSPSTIANSFRSAGFRMSEANDGGDNNSSQDTEDTEKQEPLLARLFKEFNISPSEYFGVDDDVITSESASPPTAPSPSTSTAPETVVEEASDGEDDCGEEMPSISSRAALDCVEKINAYCLRSGCADDVLESFLVFTALLEKHVAKAKSQTHITDYFNTENGAPGKADTGRRKGKSGDAGKGKSGDAGKGMSDDAEEMSDDAEEMSGDAEEMSGDAGKGKSGDAGKGKSGDAGKGKSGDAGKGMSGDAEEMSGDAEEMSGDAGKGKSGDAGKGMSDDAEEMSGDAEEMSGDAGKGKSGDAGKGKSGDAGKGMSGDAEEMSDDAEEMSGDPEDMSSDAGKDDTQTVGIVGFEPGPRQFLNPTSSSWRKQQAQRLGLPEPFHLPERKNNVDLGKPLEVNTIIGDGNCLYRAFSLEICGTEAHHEQVRAIIVDFMLKNHTKFAAYVGEDLGQYVARNNLELNTWGSDAEIYAAATLLQTPVVYTAVGETTRQWIPHMPLFSIPGVEISQERVYLRNLCGHFERVVTVV